jgi:dihydroflavonol-4-reductase
MTSTPKNSVLVTGATGFVGSSLVEALLKKGCSVACLVRSASNMSALRNMPVRLIPGDIEKPGPMRDDLRGLDTVYHVAGAIKAANRDAYFRTNQIGTRHLLEALAESSPGLRRFVYVSSLAAAGPSPDGRRLVEDEKPHPISWYGESKLQAEQEVLKFAKVFPVTILRPSAVYGPRDRETLLIFQMIRRGYLFTPGRFTRRFSLIHVEDLVCALIRAGEHSIPSGEVFFISRPETYTWAEVGHAIARALDKKYRWIPFPQRIAEIAGLAGDLWSRLSRRPTTINSQKVRELLQPSWLCDPSRARKFLGFDPQIELESGIRDTVSWYRNQGWL